ncbi:MAG TPA: DUF5309 family protein [Rhizobium sp.]|nr:DUF5309 family protein [Rhizobium sp.]
MPPFTLSYANLQRDISILLATIIAAQPTLLSIIGTAPYKAAQHKHEFPELQLTPASTTTSAGIDNAATTLPVVNKLALKANTICRIEKLDGTPSTEQIRVTAVHDSLQQATIVRGWGGTTAAAIEEGAKIIVVSRPQMESSRAALVGGNKAPSLNYNFTQIFDAEAVVSNSQGRVYGISQDAANPVDAMMDFEVRQKTLQLAREMNDSIIHGRRFQRTEAIPGTMGGLLQFHEGGNRVDAAGDPIDEELLDAAFQKCFEGGAAKVDTILCGAAQGLNLSRLYKNRLHVVREDKTLGMQILQVQSGLPIKGYLSTVVVDQSFPKNGMSLFDKDLMKLVPMRTLIDKRSEAEGDDFIARRLIGEYTAEFLNWGAAACYIDNLSIQPAS